MYHELRKAGTRCLIADRQYFTSNMRILPQQRACDPGEGMRTVDRPYPLTPALSPREREQTGLSARRTARAFAVGAGIKM